MKWISCTVVSKATMLRHSYTLTSSFSSSLSIIIVIISLASLSLLTAERCSLDRRWQCRKRRRKKRIIRETKTSSSPSPTPLPIRWGDFAESRAHTIIINAHTQILWCTKWKLPSKRKFQNRNDNIFFFLSFCPLSSSFYTALVCSALCTRGKQCVVFDTICLSVCRDVDKAETSKIWSACIRVSTSSRRQVIQKRRTHTPTKNIHRLVDAGAVCNSVTADKNENFEEKKNEWKNSEISNYALKHDYYCC